MNPFERWDDWEWEKAAQEVGRESGISPRWKPKHSKLNFKTGGVDLIKRLTNGQKRVLMAALAFLTLFFSSYSQDPISQAIHSYYRNAMNGENLYTAMNGMAKEAIGLGGLKPASVPVDVTMQGRFFPPVSGPVVAGFGETSKDEKGKTITHYGIDVGSALGVSVVAPDTGVVTFTGTDPQLGKIVKLDHGAGWTSVLGNLGDVNVQKGSRVQKGEVLGTIGLSAPIKKPWLHFEIRRNNQAVNPLPYIFKQKS
ncbi:MAG: murein hydrolase activator EnvC family protein [Desulfitobacteriaceae bacterium]